MTGAEDLTVVIPVRGRFPVLRRVLDALSSQTVHGAEVVVVIDGEDQPSGDDLDADLIVRQPHAGAGAARNRGVRRTVRPLVLLLGADMIPAPDLVERHLDAHRQADDTNVAVLGHVDWHPEVADGPLHRWLDRSGTQFDYARMVGKGGADVGFGRFYSSNVSLPRELFDRAGGFNEDFIVYYEDIDLGWRLAEVGMRLIYEPAALVHHVHEYDLGSLRRRFEGVALSERLMADMHPWFEPFFQRRFARAAARRPARRIWTRVVEHLPRDTRLARHAEREADAWYHQHFADVFLTAWDRAAHVVELRRYLGDDFRAPLLARSPHAVQEEFSAADDEVSFYRTSQAYLYDLTVFAMSGTKDAYREELRRHVPEGARLLDYGCGIGADGLELLEAGYNVEFADYDNPSTRYLRWRLHRRGIDALVWDIEHDDPPGRYHAAFAFDVIEHVADPVALLERMERLADLVVVNLLEEDPDDHEHELHYELPIGELIDRAERHGLIGHTVHHGRSHLLIYRSNV